jgi:GT2 family glycosyltransferase
MGLAARLAFLGAKAWQVVARGDGLAAGLTYLRSRTSARSQATVQAARLSGPPANSAMPSGTRPPLEPAAVAPGLAVSIIIPTKDRFDLLSACIDSLAAIADVPYEVIIIDNGAMAPAMLGVLDALRARDNVRVVRRDIPFNFSQLCNDGARLARNPLLLFLNDDVEALDGHWLSAMRGFMGRPDVGVVGARLLYPSEALQHGGIASNLIPGPGHPWRTVTPEVWRHHPLLAQAGDVDAVTGACLMISKAVFDRLGGFDEDAFAIALNDVDLCLRVRGLGLRVVYAPQATLWHKESQTRAPDQAPEEIERYRRELAVFYRRHEAAARSSVFYPNDLRRDTDAALLP